MHEMLDFAGQNVSWQMDGEACPAGGCGTHSFVPGSFSDRPRSGTDSSDIILLTFLRVVLAASVFCSSASADRNVMAASRLIGAAAACVILLSFALDIVNRIRVAASRLR